MANTKLFEEFPPISTKEWREKIDKDLKGADLEKKLVWKTIEGFNVQPYYRLEDIDNEAITNINPNQYPYLRGNKKESNDWLIRQDFIVDNIDETNQSILDALMQGVESIALYFNKKMINSQAQFDRLMRGIHPEAVEINFFSDESSADLLSLFVNFITQQNYDKQKIRGSLNLDPLVRISTKGDCLQGSIEDAYSRIIQMIKFSNKNLPLFQIISINGNVFPNAGASITQELAYSLSIANEYLTYFSDYVDIDNLAPLIRFNMGVSSNYFMEIAKVRALRYLWSKLLEAYGIKNLDSTHLFIHTQTNTWNKTVFDSYVNMLRTTTESMSAIIGGVNSHTVIPFDAVYQKTNQFSERIAKNQQIILKEEAYLDKVVDPAGGSYYIEKLTLELIENAWDLFLSIDEKGGYYQSLKKGLIQKEIKEMAAVRNLNIATKKEILLGTNQYANLLEELPVKKETKQVNKKTEIETLHLYRAAELFEELRYRTEESIKKPNVFIFTYGNLAMRKARAQFANNFFSSAGYDIKDNESFLEIEEGLNFIKNEKPNIVVLCSSDDEYLDLVSLVKQKLNDNVILVVAGYPKKDIEQLKQKGVDYFIHVKTNLLQTLQEFNNKLL